VIVINSSTATTTIPFKRISSSYNNIITINNKNKFNISDINSSSSNDDNYTLVNLCRIFGFHFQSGRKLYNELFLLQNVMIDDNNNDDDDNIDDKDDVGNSNIDESKTITSNLVDLKDVVLFNIDNFNINDDNNHRSNIMALNSMNNVLIGYIHENDDMNHILSSIQSYIDDISMKPIKSSSSKAIIIIITNTKALKESIDSSINAMINDVFENSMYAPIEVDYIHCCIVLAYHHHHYHNIIVIITIITFIIIMIIIHHTLHSRC
jgi:hypothetical protein